MSDPFAQFDSHPIRGALCVAVPLRIHTIMQLTGQPTDADIEQARGFASTLGERGDVLLYGSKKRGEAAALFNQLARAIAVLSFCPGGIKIFGEHWASGEHNSEVGDE